MLNLTLSSIPKPNTRKYKAKTPYEKLWANFWFRVNLPNVIGTDECWEWNGRTDKNGYGSLGVRIDRQRKTLTAHRVSHELNIGPVPIGMFVLHRCDNPACVNPSHLWLGTHTDNMKDMVNKRRHRWQK